MNKKLEQNHGKVVTALTKCFTVVAGKVRRAVALVDFLLKLLVADLTAGAPPTACLTPALTTCKHKHLTLFNLY